VNWLAQRPALRLRVDLTQHGRNTLADRTLTLLRSLESPVECATFFRPDDLFLGAVQGEVARLAEGMLRNMERAGGDKFPVRIFDLSSGSPDLAEARAKHRELNLSDVNLLVVKAGSRQKEVRLDDLADLDRGDMGMFGGAPRPPRILAFKGEEAVANAILSVTEEGERKATFVRGHGEGSTSETGPQGLSRWAEVLRRDGYEVSEWNLPEKRHLPEDASLVLVVGPRHPFAPEETAALERYLDGGGRALVALDWSQDPEAPADPTGVLERFGVKPGRGIACELLLDVIRGQYVHGTAQCATVSGIPSSAHEITRPLASAEITPLVPFSRPLERASEASADVRTTHLLETGSRAWEDLPVDGKVNFAIDEDRESEGRQVLAMAVERAAPADSGEAAGDGNLEGAEPPGKETSEKKPARLVVLGSALAATNEAIEQYGRDFLANAVNWLADRARLLGIAPKPVEERRVDLEAPGTRIRLFWICVVAFPLLFVGTGLGVWWIRRR
jgi:hypothetical protein